MGTLVQAPPSDAQPVWTTLVRFSRPEQLDAWLASPQRQELLRQSEGLEASWKSHRMPSSFAGWFAGGEAEHSAPAAWKQTAIVLLVLFPAVMLELRFLSPRLAGLNPALATFIGNAISVALVTWPLAPLAIRSLRWWLQPDPAHRARAGIFGVATVAALYAIELGIFWTFLQRIGMETGGWMTEEDRRFMQRAIDLSEKTSLIDSAGGVFGTVIVQNGEIIGEGANRVVAENDPTWHGEIQAIRSACKKVGNFKLEGATLYTSAEPCPMCAAAAYWAGIERIFYAATCEDALEYGDFDDTMIYRELAKPAGERSIQAQQIMQEEAVEVWKKYKKKPDRVPY